MNYREFTKKLRAIGCREIVRRGGGSYRKWLNPVTGGGTIIPDWGQKDLKAGTISAVCRQLGIDRNSCDKWNEGRNSKSTRGKKPDDPVNPG